MQIDRLEAQIAFIVEIDKLKRVLRQSFITDKSRQENDAEHSWHLAIMAVLLAEHSNEPVDLLKVVKMLLVHDLVEIDAGDTFAYDEKGHDDKPEREQRAADRIFAILPSDQAQEYRALWDEFEEGATSEARFAAAMDRLAPMLLNYQTGGAGWKKHGVTADRVLKRNSNMAAGSETLWAFARQMIEEAVSRGFLHSKPSP